MDIPEKIIEAIKLHEHTEDVELVKADVQYSRDGIGETIARAVIGKCSSKVRNYFLRWDQQKEKFEVKYIGDSFNSGTDSTSVSASAISTAGLIDLDELSKLTEEEKIAKWKQIENLLWK